MYPNELGSCEIPLVYLPPVGYWTRLFPTPIYIEPYIYAWYTCAYAYLMCYAQLRFNIKAFEFNKPQSSAALSDFASCIRGNQVARFAIIIQYTVICLWTFAPCCARALNLSSGALICPTFRPRTWVCIPAGRPGFALASLVYCYFMRVLLFSQLQSVHSGLGRCSKQF